MVYIYQSYRNVVVIPLLELIVLLPALPVRKLSLLPLTLLLLLLLFLVLLVVVLLLARSRTQHQKEKKQKHTLAGSHSKILYASVLFIPDITQTTCVYRWVHHFGIITIG